MIEYALPILLAILIIPTKALDWKGIVTAVAISYIVIISQNSYWFLVVLTFFLIGSIATRYKEDIKRLHKTTKQKARTVRHILANGGVAVIMAILGQPYAFIGSLASATTDTVSSEIGILSKRNPVMITTFRRVEKGVNGGVSPLGTIAGAISAIAIGIVSLTVIYNIKVVYIALTAGLVGCFVDSYVGAIFENPGYIKNWGTNFIATVSGAVCGLLMGMWL